PEGELELPHPALAADQRAPFIESQVGVARPRPPHGVDLLDRPQERLHQIEGVDAEVAEGIAGRAVLRRQRAARVGRVHRAAQDVDATTSPSAPARTASSALLTWGSKSSEWQTPSCSPCARARSRSRRQSSASVASGFSTKVWQPARSASVATAACV